LRIFSSVLKTNSFQKTGYGPESSNTILKTTYDKKTPMIILRFVQVMNFCLQQQYKTTKALLKY